MNPNQQETAGSTTGTDSPLKGRPAPRCGDKVHYFGRHGEFFVGGITRVYQPIDPGAEDSPYYCWTVDIADLADEQLPTKVDVDEFRDLAHQRSEGGYWLPAEPAENDLAEALQRADRAERRLDIVAAKLAELGDNLNTLRLRR